MLFCSLFASAYTNPVVSHDFPDPAIVRLPDGTFAAFATQGGGSRIQCATSSDLVTWTDQPDALPALPAWASGRSCAPDVQLHGDTYVMYFLTYKSGTHTNCIGVATSKVATGPYTPQGDAPIICDGDGHTQHWTAMDPRSYDHADGSVWLYFGSHSSPIVAAQLDSSRLVLHSNAKIVPVVQPDSSSYGHTIEGPWVYTDPAGGALTMFYSGSQCCGAGAHYAAMAARSPSGHPLGPWVKLGGEAGDASVVLASAPGRVSAPGHNAVVRDDAGVDWLLYHANVGPQCNASYCTRALFLDRLQCGSRPNLRSLASPARSARAESRRRYDRTFNGSDTWPSTAGPTFAETAAPVQP